MKKCILPIISGYRLLNHLWRVALSLSLSLRVARAHRNRDSTSFATPAEFRGRHTRIYTVIRVVRARPTTSTTHSHDARHEICNGSLEGNR